MLNCGKDKDFMRFKIGHYFDLLDFNNSGHITQDDMWLWCEKSAQAYRESGTPLPLKQQRLIQDRLVYKLFNLTTLWGWSGKNKKRHVNFTITSLKMPGSKFMSNKLCKDIFAASDVDGSGGLSEEEYFNCMMYPWGVNREEGKVCFDLIDSDKNGWLSVEELANAMWHFFTELEVNEYAFVLGPLPIDKVPEKYREAVENMQRDLFLEA